MIYKNFLSTLILVTVTASFSCSVKSDSDANHRANGTNSDRDQQISDFLDRDATGMEQNLISSDKSKVAAPICIADAENEDMSTRLVACDNPIAYRDLELCEINGKFEVFEFPRRDTNHPSDLCIALRCELIEDTTLADLISKESKDVNGISRHENPGKWFCYVHSRKTPEKNPPEDEKDKQSTVIQFENLEEGSVASDKMPARFLKYVIRDFEDYPVNNVQADPIPRSSIERIVSRVDFSVDQVIGVGYTFTIGTGKISIERILSKGGKVIVEYKRSKQGNEKLLSFTSAATFYHFVTIPAGTQDVIFVDLGMDPNTNKKK